MLRHEYLSIVDNICRDQACDNALRQTPFGGKVVLLGGDWRQLLPIVPHENALAQLGACVKSSALYPLFTPIILTRNMRVRPNEIAFLRLLEAVGTTAGVFKVPNAMRVASLDELIDFVYDGGRVLTRPNELQHCLLLALKRVEVRLLNDTILAMVAGQSREYLSADESLVQNPLNVYAANHDVATLNEIDVSEMPPHRLTLKVGAIVVLLRNVDVVNGLSNGTRLEVLEMQRHFIRCRIVTGPRHNRTCTLQYFQFEYQDKRVDGSGVHMTRFQLPVALAFAMTVNKAQGQTAARLGLYLRDQVFSHGQLYVALSRVRTADSVRLYVQDSDVNQPLEIDNIVFTDVLDK